MMGFIVYGIIVCLCLILFTICNWLSITYGHRKEFFSNLYQTELFISFIPGFNITIVIGRILRIIFDNYLGW